MLKRVLSFELSSGFSDTYASGLEVVVVSVVDAMEVVGDGAGDALVLLEEGSSEGELMSTGEWWWYSSMIRKTIRGRGWTLCCWIM